MADNGRLRGLLTRIGDELEHLRRLSALTAEDLQRDPDRLAGVKYRFIVAIEVSRPWRGSAACSCTATRWWTTTE